MAERVGGAMAAGVGVIGLANEGLERLTVAIENGGRLVIAVQNLSSNVVTAVDKALTLLQEVNKKEVKLFREVKIALRRLISVAAVACGYLDKVDDLLYYCQSDMMVVAREGLSSSPPDLTPLCNLMAKLDELLKMVENKYLELEGAFNAEIVRSNEAVEDCACKERESRNKKRATRGIGGAATGTLVLGAGGAAAGAVVAGGVTASAVAGLFTFGIGTIVGLAITAGAAATVGLGSVAAGVGTGVATHYIAKDYKKSEDSFRKIGADFDAIFNHASELHEGALEIHTLVANITAQVDSINNTSDEDIVMIKVTLKRLNDVCAESYGITSRCRRQVKSKMDRLKAELK